MNYLMGIVVVAVGIFFGFMATNVNNLLQWIVGGLYGGYVAANCLKWYWWRFNANGFFWGMTIGIVGALVMAKYIPGNAQLNWWPLLFVLSMAGCIIGTYAAEPTEEATLKSFYKTVRPWGFWKPIHQLVIADDPTFVGNKGFKLDMFNVVLGIIAQLCLTILPMYLILSMHLPLFITLGILIVIIIILKKTWWNKLED